MSDETATWVEIDITVCSRRFGVAPCMAALGPRFTRKCVNTFRTCGDTDNYDAETITITLTKQGQVGLPIEGRYFPCLLSVRESEQTVNIAGSDTKLEALGRRASVEIEASDFVYADRFLDPYWDERLSGAAQFDGIGYEPQGTFWQRLRARDPYFAGYPIRVHHGRVVDGALITDRTLHYIATEFDPSDGSARWRGVDVLDLAANERALVPKPSQGRLLADLAIDATSLTLTPSGVGDEYASAGYVTIGREIIRYHSKSGDTLGGLVRGRFNTPPSQHGAFAAVQEAWRYTGPAYQAVNVLLTGFAPVPASWVPISDWEAEAMDWFSVEVDVIVTKPIPVSKAVGELSILGFSLFTDLVAQKIRFRPNRPLFPAEAAAALEITDADVVGQPKYEGRDSERLTRVEFRSVQIDPTQELSDSNFVQQYFAIDGDAEDPRAYGDIRYRLEKTRWLNQGANAVIRILAQRYLLRFSSAPERVTLTVKRRKYDAVNLTDVVNLTLRKIPSPWGAIERKAYQVRTRAYANSGEIVLGLQRYDYTDTYGFWAPNDAPDYDDATEAQKDEMAFWGPNDADEFADGRPLYKWS
jgi:hypothetical protein